VASASFKRVTARERADEVRFRENLIGSIVKVMGDIRKRNLVRRALIYSTWQGETPTFQGEISAGHTLVTLSIKFSGGWHKGNKKWLWVNDGTKIRYAWMTPDFEPKTQHRTLRGKAGKGGLWLVRPKHPKPGIEARELDEEIAVVEVPFVRKDLETAFREAIRMSVG
jgi:hypothetical protein